MIWIWIGLLVVLVSAVVLACVAAHQEVVVTTLNSGDSIVLTEDQDGFIHECCECGLRHIVYVKVNDGVELQWVVLEGGLQGFDFSQGQCVRLDRGKNMAEEHE